jgi:hypothetical protein
MKIIAYLLGLVLIVIAAIYLFVPADQLPSFMPGYEAGLTRVRVKHGIASGVLGIVLFIAGMILGRSKA